MTDSRARFDSNLRRHLRRELIWLRARLIGHALLALLGGLGLIFGVSVLTAPGWTVLGPWGAWVLWACVAFVVSWVAIAHLWRPLAKTRGLEEFSHEVERHESFGNLLEAATQFESTEHSDPVSFGASKELVDEVLRRATERVQATKLSPTIPLAGLGQNLGLAILALLVWWGLGDLTPDRFDLAWRGFTNPNSLNEIVPTSGVHAGTRDLRIPVGSDVVLEARDFTRGTGVPLLEVNRTGDFWQEQDAEVHSPPLDPAPYRVLRVQLDDVEDPFRYRFRRGSVVGPVFAVEVQQRPVVRTVELSLLPPSYSDREPSTLVDPAGVVSVLAGTQIILRGEASVVLESAERIDDESDSTTALSVDGAAFADTFTVVQDMSFRLRLVDGEGLPSEALTVYRLVAQPDASPSVQILSPAADLLLERDLIVPIEGIAADDVGLLEMHLVYRSELDSEWTRQLLYRAGAANVESPDLIDLELDVGEFEVALRFTWDLGDLALLPGDGIVYALEATDNNELEGGQVSRSRTWRLRLPTIAEIFEVDREERSDESEDLRELLVDGKELKEDLERLNRELMKEPDPDWTKKEEIRETLERQQALREQLKDSVGELQKQVEEFERNNAGSMELLEKMDTIQELLEELKDDESLQAYLEAMRDAMDDLSPQEIQRQMEDSLAEQEEFNRRLDRTIELLKQLEQERRMSDLVEETNEHLRRQEQIAELTKPEPSDSQEGEESESGEESDSGEENQEQGQESEAEPEKKPTLDDEDLARMQQKLAEEVKDLEERLQEELERMENEEGREENESPSAEEMKKALEKALEELKENKPSEPMEQAEEELSQGDRSEAQEQQDEARRRLLSLYEILMQGESLMQQAQGKWAGEQLQKSAFDLLELSHREEDVLGALQDGVRGQNMRPLTREQSRVQRATKKLSDDLHELARQDFNVSERLLGKMRDLVMMLDESVDELNLSRPTRSKTAANEVMAEMNTLVISLLTSANSSGNGGGGSPMPTPSEQMRQMAEEQSRLNGMSKQLRERMKHGLSGEERRQLTEMKARQQQIREQLENLRKSVEDERRILGDLEDLAESMETVEDDLGAGKLDENTQRQQEKILSRLLDAERSIRERDFAKRRESRGSEDIFSQQEGVDGEDAESERENALRRWTAPERAPQAYREDVRRYFRSIQRELEAGKGKQ